MSMRECRRPYRDEGARTRFSYHPTPEAEELLTVLGTLQQWASVRFRGCPFHDAAVELTGLIDRAIASGSGP